eukprot:TRINITY_DN66722_c4_g1_i1.p1 TRINITY_DN66722_c4_g1~~TRINITY_DN66722_c4_g1_i1.p1  ORF type:complete len:197 (+),score=24.62 TRINITY_DN66722_c4_g1_i1:91-681(+)
MSAELQYLDSPIHSPDTNTMAPLLYSVTVLHEPQTATGSNFLSWKKSRQNKTTGWSSHTPLITVKEAVRLLEEADKKELEESILSYCGVPLPPHLRHRLIQYKEQLLNPDGGDQQKQPFKVQLNSDTPNNFSVLFQLGKRLSIFVNNCPGGLFPLAEGERRIGRYQEKRDAQYTKWDHHQNEGKMPEVDMSWFGKL